MLPASQLRYLGGRLGTPVHDAAQEREWLRAVAESQDRTAFGHLCHRYMARVRNFLRPRCGDEAEAITQEVLLTVWRKAKLYAPEKAAPSTWIFTIARNRAVDHSRRRRPRPSSTDPHFVRGAGSDEVEAPDVGAARLQESVALHESLAALPPEQRAVLEGVYLRSLTLRETAEELSIPLGTAKSRVRLALANLRKQLAEKGHAHA